MPLVSFKPTKARLVIEDGKDSVLVMRVAVAKGESVELAGGGRLEALSGVLRIRERKVNARVNGSIGSLVFIDESGRGTDYAPAKFQINLGMAADKFEPLLRVALQDACRTSSSSTLANEYRRARHVGSRTDSGAKDARRSGTRRRSARCPSPTSQ